MDERICDAMRNAVPMVPPIQKNQPGLPVEVVRILALGSRLARLVQRSPIEPHIKALATEFVHRADKVTGDV